MKQLHPKAKWLIFINQFLFVLFVLAVASVGFSPIFSLLIENPDTYFQLALATVPFVALFVLFWSNLSYKFYRYELTENSFNKELGVIWKKYVSIPYDRIQNVDIYRGVWARLLNLSDLHIQTAGASNMQGQKSEGRLPGLLKEDAEKLRDELLRLAQKFKNQGL